MASNEMDYKRYLVLIKRDKKLCIIVALIIMTLVTAGAYVIPNKYEAKSTVFVEKSVLSELLKGITFTPSTEDKIKVLTYALNSRTLITKIIDELDLRKTGDNAELESLILSLQKNTQIKIKDREGLFVVSFKDNNPKLARDYVNALVRRYIDENTSSKREESYGATKFLSEQLTTFRDKLQKTEDEVNAFKRGSGSIATMDTGNLLKDINDSQQRADDLKIKEAQLETVLAGLGRVNTTQSNLPALQKRLQELRLQYTDSYPEIIRLKDEIHGVEEQKKNAKPTTVRPSDSPEYDRLNSELRAIRQAESNLRATIEKNRSLLRNIPAARAELDNLEREKQSQKSLYESMLARQGQSEVSKQMEVQDKSTVFRVVDPAVLPIMPVSPDRKRLILLGILAGIGGGLGLVILKDQMDDTVKSVDMARLFGLPVLAVIPHIEDPEQHTLQTRRDRKLYAAGGLYFLVILAVLVFEVFGFTMLYDLVHKIIALMR
ncbi:MAG: GNVR domain-containing protein [Desulfuromonadaceae bacterium]|nr:GNVR domain-containing protein [Desulfuromonadaceae bacterium]